MKKQILGIALSLIAFTLHGQDWKTELQMMNNAFRPEKPVRMKVMIRYFESENQAVPKDSLTGDLVIQKSNYHYAIGENIFLKNENFAMRLDKTGQTIEVVDAEAVRTGYLPFQVLDSLVQSKQIQVRNVKTIPGKGCFRMEFMKGQYRFVELSYDKKTHRLEAMVMQLRKNPDGKEGKGGTPRIVLRFDDYSLDAGGISLISGFPYVLKKNGKLALSSKYNHYRLLNHIKE